MIRPIHFGAATILLAASAYGGSPAFFDRQDYPLNLGAVGDVNGDGFPDLVSSIDAGVTVWLGNGDGTFHLGPTSNLNSFQGFPALADMNGDGKLDLVIVGTSQLNGVADQLAVCLGNGDGTFAEPSLYSFASGDNLESLVVADFNGDGLLDVAASGNQGVWVTLGTAADGFGSGTLYAAARAANPTQVVAVDLNGDGKLDMAALAETGFTVFLGNGDGTFQPAIFTASAYTEVPEFITAGYLSGGAYPAVLIADNNKPYVLEYKGNGDGTFQAPTYLNLLINSGLAIGDVNGDGIPDLVTDSAYIAFGESNGAFRPPVYYPIGNGPHGNPAEGVFLSDLRGLGRLDIVTANIYDTTSVLLNLGKGTYEDGIWTPVQGGGAFCAVSADFNGNGHAGLAVGTPQGVSILFGTGLAKAPFSQGPILDLPGQCGFAADVNGDGIPDLLFEIADPPPSTAGTLVAYLGNGDGTFTPSTPVALSHLGAIAVGDFNGDGKADIANTWNLLALGNGDGTFQTPVPFVPKVLPGTQARGFTAIVAADLNNDGKPDLALTDVEGNYLYILINNGKGGWRESILSTGSPFQCVAPFGIAVGDVNGDHKPDILLGGTLDSACIYANQGGGTFAFSQVLTTASSRGTNPLIADVNGDGITDVLILNANDVSIFLGQGAGKFAAPFILGTGWAPVAFFALDAHGQPASAGIPDLVVPDSITGKVETILNLNK